MYTLQAYYQAQAVLMAADPNTIEDERIREMVTRAREVVMADLPLTTVDAVDERLQAMAEGDLQLSQDGTLKSVQ